MSFKTTVFGKYFLIDRIAVGGMAEVFKAKTFGIRGFERLLVIKRILPHLSTDDEFVEMFIDEAKISVELTHANICQVTDLGNISENYFIAMEFIDGKDVRALLKKCYQEKKFLPIPLSIYLAMEALKGLDYAHRKADPMSGSPLNIIHRDISPQNIMASYDGEVKIVDFGIAKTAAKINRTQAGVLKGKFGYMSPEQASGLELDARTDVFSAAIILFECLTGRRLFLGETDFDTLEKIKRCQIPSPRQYNPNVTEELEAVLMRGLAKQPEDRYQSAQEMQAALAKIFFTKHAESGGAELSSFLRGIFSEEIRREKESLKIALDSLPPAEVAAVAAAAKSGSNPFIASGGSQSLAGTGSGRSVPIGSVLVSQSRQSQGIMGRIQSLMHTAGGRWATSLAIFGGVILGAVLALNLFPQKAQYNGTTPQASGEVFKVELISKPKGAEVWLDGKKACGPTPCQVEMAPGLFRVKITLPGYEDFLERKMFTEDQSRYLFRLEKLIPKLGTLHVKTVPPGAEILLDGQETGLKTNSPLEGLELERKYVISVQRPGYESDPEIVYMMEAEQEVVVHISQRKVKLDLGNGLPSGARVFLRDPDSGKYEERGDEILDLDAGVAYKVKITAKGYRNVIRTYTLFDNKVDSIRMKRRVSPMGTIEVGASPWANIYVDGKLIAKEMFGFYKATLSVGKHTFKFVHPEYPRPITKEVKIKKGRNTKVLVRFD